MVVLGLAFATAGEMTAPDVDAPPAAELLSGIEAEIPAGSVAVLKIVDPAGLPATISGSPLGEAVRSLESLGGAVQAAVGSARATSMMFTGTRLEDLHDLFDGDIAVVLLEPLNRDEDREPSVVAVARVAGDGTALRDVLEEKLRPAIAGMYLNVEFEVNPYKGVAVTDFRVGDAGMAGTYVLSDGLFLLGTQRGVRKFLDARQAGSPTLAADAGYVASMQALEIDTGLMLYVNAKKLIPAAEDDERGRDRGGFRRRVLRANSIQFIVWGLEYSEDGAHENAFIKDDGSAPGLAAILPKAEAEPLGVARLVPRQFTTFTAMDLGPGREVWAKLNEIVLQAGGEQAEMQFRMFLAFVEGRLGLTFEEDLLPSLAGEMFCAVDSRKWGESVRTRKPAGSAEAPVMWGFKISDQEKVQAVIQQILQSNLVWDAIGMDERAETYRDVEVHILNDPDREDTSPSYAFLDGYLLFAFQSETLKAAIDAAKDGQSLATREDYAAASAKLPPGACVRVFCETKEVLPGLFDALGETIAQPLNGAAPELSRAAGTLDPIIVDASAAEDGVRLRIASPMGSPMVAAMFEMFLDAARRAWVNQTWDQLEQIAGALEAYRADYGTYPSRLGDNMLEYLHETPRDIFSQGWRDPMISYSPGPAMQTATGRTVNTTGWMLSSIGPDGKRDVNVRIFAPDEWKAFLNGNDLAEKKRKIYQFEPKLNKDERETDDEGDIILTGPLDDRVDTGNE